VCGNGFYLFQVFDDYSVPLPLLIISLFQVLAIGWVYGIDKYVFSYCNFVMLN